MAQRARTTPSGSAPDVQRLSPLVLGLVLAAHLGVFAALMALRAADPVPIPATALIVDVIRSTAAEKTKPAIAPSKPETVRPKPKPVPQPPRARPVVQTSVLAAENPRSVAAAEVAREVQPVAPPPSVATTAVPADAPPAKQAAPVAVAQTAPRFDADYLSNPAPAYPPQSRRAGEEGQVMLRVFVEPSGIPGKVEVRTGSGFALLDRAAVSAVSHWKFIPARQGADPVGGWVLVPINFKLKA
jgi:protein TonB